MYCKTYRLKIVLLIWAIVISTATFAQGKSTRNSNQQWIQYYEKAKLNSHWTLLADAGYRRKDLFAETSQYIVRVAMDYQMNPNMRISAGFANLGFYTSGTLSKLEFRPYEEWMITHKYNSVKIQHRFRVEERIFKTASDGIIQPASSFNFRFRYRLMFNIPILNLSKSKSGSKLSLNAGDEILLNAGHSIVYNIFDQNRILIGPAIKIDKNFSVSLTYNDQLASATTPGKFKHTDVIWLGIKHQFGVTNHKKRN